MTRLKTRLNTQAPMLNLWFVPRCSKLDSWRLPIACVMPVSTLRFTRSSVTLYSTCIRVFSDYTLHAQVWAGRTWDDRVIAIASRASPSAGPPSARHSTRGSTERLTLVPIACIGIGIGAVSKMRSPPRGRTRHSQPLRVAPAQSQTALECPPRGAPRQLPPRKPVGPTSPPTWTDGRAASRLARRHTWHIPGPPEGWANRAQAAALRGRGTRRGQSTAPGCRPHRRPSGRRSCAEGTAEPQQAWRNAQSSELAPRLV